MRRAVILAGFLVLLSAWPAAGLSVTRTIPVGSQPFGVAASGSLLYVANSGGSAVSVIDTATNTVTGSIAVGSGPGEIAADPAAGRAYVANFNSGTVSVVDLATRATVATLGTGGLGVALDPGLGRLYVVTPSQLTVFDTATLQPVAAIPASGAGWWAVAVDPVRHIGYLGGLSGQGITVLDLMTNAVVTTIGVAGPIRFALAVDPARGLVYAATDTKPGTLSVIDAATNTVTRTIVVGDLPSHIMPVSASTVYVTDLGSNDLAVVDPGTGAVTRTPLGSNPAGLAAVGSTTYVALNGANSVVTLGNNPPTIDSVSVSPSNARTNDTLTATVSARDADGDALTYGYQWTRNGTDISGATGSTLDLSVPGNGSRGDSIAVRVTASDGSLTSAPRTSTAVVIADSAPVATVALSPISPTTQSVMTATATASDADGDALSLTYVWTVNGVVRRTTVTASMTDSFDLGRPANGNKGDVVAVELTASDATLTSAHATASAVIGRGR